MQVTLVNDCNDQQPSQALSSALISFLFAAEFVAPVRLSDICLCGAAYIHVIRGEESTGSWDYLQRKSSWDYIPDDGFEHVTYSGSMDNIDLPEVPVAESEPKARKMLHRMRDAFFGDLIMVVFGL